MLNKTLNIWLYKWLQTVPSIEVHKPHWRNATCNLTKTSVKKIIWSMCMYVCMCVCVRACVRACVRVCLFPSTVKASPDWNKTIDVMPEIRPTMLCWGNYCVKYLRRHVINNHSWDLQASNCARVSIKPGRTRKSKRQLLELSKNQW